MNGWIDPSPTMSELKATTLLLDLQRMNADLCGATHEALPHDALSTMLTAPEKSLQGNSRMPAMKVVIADDHPIVLMGMGQMIQRDSRFTLVGEAVSSSQLIEQMHKHQPEVVITDFNMPGDDAYGDGLRMIEYIIRHFPTTKILVLTMISNSMILARLQALGVAGVIQKNHMKEEIGHALGTLSTRRGYQGIESARALGVSNQKQADELISSLSPREIEVLRLLVAGMSVNDIARQLSRSKKTVSAQKIAAMRKLGADSDFALLTYCIETKLFNE